MPVGGYGNAMGWMQKITSSGLGSKLHRHRQPEPQTRLKGAMSSLRANRGKQRNRRPR